MNMLIKFFDRRACLLVDDGSDNPKWYNNGAVEGSTITLAAKDGSKIGSVTIDTDAFAKFKGELGAPKAHHRVVGRGRVMDMDVLVFPTKDGEMFGLVPATNQATAATDLF